MKGEDVKRRHLFDSSHFIPAINHVYLGNSGAMTGERFFHPQKKKFRSMEVHIWKEKEKVQESAKKQKSSVWWCLKGCLIQTRDLLITTGGPPRKNENRMVSLRQLKDFKDKRKFTLRHIHFKSSYQDWWSSMAHGPWHMAHGTWHMSFLQDYVCVRVAIYDVVKGLQQVVDEVRGCKNWWMATWLWICSML